MGFKQLSICIQLQPYTLLQKPIIVHVWLLSLRKSCAAVEDATRDSQLLQSPHFLLMTIKIASDLPDTTLLDYILYLMQHLYNPGILPGSAQQFIHGLNVYLITDRCRQWPCFTLSSVMTLPMGFTTEGSMHDPSSCLEWHGPTDNINRYTGRHTER